VLQLKYIDKIGPDKRKGGLKMLPTGQSQDQIFKCLLNLAASSAKLMLWRYNPATRTGYTVEGSVTIPGLPLDGMQNLPESLLPYVEVGSIPNVMEFYQHMHRGDQQASCEIWYKATEEHAPICSRMNCALTVASDGKTPEYVCVAQDISLEKVVSSQYNRIMAGITRGMEHFLSIAFVNVSRNTTTNIYSASKLVPALQKAANYDALVLAFSKGFVDDFCREHYVRTCTRKALLETFNKGESQGNLRFRYHLSSGGTHWLDVSYSMARNPLTGDIEGISYVRDINTEVQREQALRRLTDWDFECIAIIDLEGKDHVYLSQNEKADQILPSQIMDYDEGIKYMAEHLVSPEQKADYLKNISRTGLLENLKQQPNFSYSVSIRDEAGVFHRKLLHYNYLDEERHAILLSAMDITDSYLQHLEETKAVRSMLQREEQALKYRTDFFSNISHDMRTPLNGILGFTDLALESQDQKQIHQYLSKIKLSGGLLLDLINDTLMLSKLESGKLQPHYEIIDNRLLSGRIIIPVQVMADEKHVTLVQDRSRSPHVLLKADRVNTQKIFINLMSNAVKFTPPGGKVEIIMEQLTQPQYDCNYRFIVRDTGIGISKEFLPHIFEPFMQEDHPQNVKDNAQGTGLGLAIVKQLVDLLHGHLEVVSEKGKGTAFTVFLPLPVVQTVAGEPEWVPGAAVPEPEPVAKLPGAVKECSRLPVKILLCEDNYLNMEIAVTILRKRGYLVDTAVNGKLGVEKFTASPAGTYAAILMDIRMPVLNGYEAARTIRKLDRPDAATIPIIALSADAYDEDIQKAKAAGMTAHLSKPIQPEEFFATLAQLSRKE
jgi:signal transduction histidine kinase